jgi:hypothetical protein
MMVSRRSACADSPTRPPVIEAVPRTVKIAAN